MLSLGGHNAALCLICFAAQVGCGASPSERPAADTTVRVGRSSPAANTVAPVPIVQLGPRVPILDCEAATEHGYKNGRRFPIEVISIDGRQVELATANAYWAMQLAAAADGLELRVYSGFRSHSDQEYFFRCFKTCSCNSCNPAARPGYSKHQSGRALDISQHKGVHAWLIKNAKRFRFYATVRSEPWHWEFRPRRRGAKQLGRPPLCQRASAATTSHR